MQHGYGAPEIQQFLVDGCSLFSLSHDINNKHLEQQQQQQQHQQHQQQQRFSQQLLPTHQFFHQHHHHHHHHHHRFQAFQQQNNSPARIVPLLGNFKPSLTESIEPLTDEDAFAEEDSAIRGPVWKFADLAYSNKGTKRCKEESVGNKFLKKGEESEEQHEEDGGKNSTSYRLFGELEAIYGGSSNKASAASSSALTGENPPPVAIVKSGMPETGNTHIDFGSETSAEAEAEAEAALKKVEKKNRKRKRKQLKSIAVFFESLVNKLMEYQEGLHSKFLDIMERRDQERMSREEAWRRLESTRLNRETSIRVQEQALASSREAAIVSFLEKITGETINLPVRQRSVAQEETHKEEEEEEQQQQKQEKQTETSEAQNNNNSNNSTRRWPRTEVQALVRVRYSLEQRFQEPGLKGPLWEEVSSIMASMGYYRSAKRCKEKWENINKYFRKTKGSAKKRPQHSKTCPYFYQLDLLYGKTHNSPSSSSSKTMPIDQAGAATVAAGNDNSELLDAIVPADHGNWRNPSLDFAQDQFKLHELGSLKLDFNSNASYKEASGSKAGKGLMEQLQEWQNEEDEDEDDDDDEDADDEDEDDDEGNIEEEEEEEEDGGHEREKREKENFGTFLDLVHKLTADATAVGGGGKPTDISAIHSDHAPSYTAG